MDKDWLAIRKNTIPGTDIPMIEGMPPDLSSGLTRTEGEFDNNFNAGYLRALLDVKDALAVLESTTETFYDLHSHSDISKPIDWRTLLNKMIGDAEK